MKSLWISVTILLIGCVEGPARNYSENATAINKDSIKISCNCPPEKPVEIDANGDTIFTKLETDASFPYGFDSLKHFLEKNINLKIPLRSGAPKGNYTVIIMFVVDKDGKTSRFKALTKNGYGMEEEALRVYKKLKKFKPGTIEGRNVSSYRKAPVVFKISN